MINRIKKILLIILMIFGITIKQTNVYAESNGNRSVLIDYKNEINKIVPVDGSGSADMPVVVTPNDTQNFFSASGDARVTYDDQGRWSNIIITPNQTNKVGNISLNMRINMNKPVEFHWQIKLTPSGKNNADGVGFIFHPTRTIANDPIALNGLHDYGIKGGNLGISDLMRGTAFKFDPYRNQRTIGKKNNTVTGDSSHGKGDKEEVYQDSDYGNTPYGTYVTTDETGFGNIVADNQNSNKLKLTDKTMNLVSGNWLDMSIQYDPTNQRMHVNLTDNNSDSKSHGKSIDWDRDLTDAEKQTLQDTDDYYAFAISGSTGYYSEGQEIRNVGGTFTPERSLISSYVDANGNNLQNSNTLTHADNGSDLYTDSAPTNLANPSNANNSNWKLSQANIVTYDDSGKASIHKISEREITKSDDKWSYEVNFLDSSSITYVQWVYRKTDKIPTLKMTAKNLTTNGSEGSSITAKDGDEIQLKYSLQNNNDNRPEIWESPFAVLPINEQVELASDNDNSSIEKLDGRVRIHLTDSGNNKIYKDKIATGSINIIYHPYAGSDESDTKNITSWAYDKSQLNMTTIPISTSDLGNNVYPSNYFYDSSVNDGPETAQNNNLDSSENYDLQHIIKSPGITLSPDKSGMAYTRFHYWDIDSADEIDPKKSNTPQNDLYELNPNPTSDYLGKTVKENLPDTTSTVDDVTGNAPAPDLSNKDYYYVGYYEYDGKGGNSSWHQYDSQNKTNNNYEGRYKSDSSNDPQTIAFIYRKIPGMLTLTTDNIDFGKHSINDSKNNQVYKSLNDYSVKVNDNRKKHSENVDEQYRAWKLYVKSDNLFISDKNNQNTLISTILGLADPEVEKDDPNNEITYSNLSIPMLDSGEKQLYMTNSGAISNVNSRWKADNISLKVPKQVIVPGKYSTTITWSLENSI